MKPERKNVEKKNGLLKSLQKNRVKAGLGADEKMDESGGDSTATSSSKDESKTGGKNQGMW